MVPCAVMNDGRLACWGDAYGEVPNIVEGPTRITDVAMWREACALGSDGQLGRIDRVYEEPRQRLIFAPTPGGSGFATIAGCYQGDVEARFGCGIRSGRPACADGEPKERWAAVEEMGRVKSLSGGQRWVCGVREVGPIACWHDDAKELDIIPIEDADEVVVDPMSDYGCARVEGGKVRCFTLPPEPPHLWDPGI